MDHPKGTIPVANNRMNATPVLALTVIPASAILLTMISFLQIVFGMFSVRADQCRPKSDFLSGLPALAAIVILFAFHTARADTDGPYTYTITDSNATITDFDSAYSGALSITNILGGRPVTSIGYRAFYNCTSLTSVTIPDSVTSIGRYAFWGCTSLTSITIPDSVTSIGWNAFYDCTSMTSVTIGNSVTTIGWDAFRDCTLLFSVYFCGNPPSTLGSSVFDNTPTTLYYLPEHADQ